MKLPRFIFSIMNFAVAEQKQDDVFTEISTPLPMPVSLEILGVPVGPPVAVAAADYKNRFTQLMRDQTTGLQMIIRSHLRLNLSRSRSSIQRFLRHNRSHQAVALSNCLLQILYQGIVLFPLH